MMKKLPYKLVYITGIFLLLASCSNHKLAIEHGDLIIEINDKMQTRVNTLKTSSYKLTGQFSESEFLETRKEKIQGFSLDKIHEDKISDHIGKGRVFHLTGSYKGRNGTNIEKIVEIRLYDSLPGMAVYKVDYINKGDRYLLITKWANNAYMVMPKNDTPEFWSFQGSSSNARADWILPVNKGFYKKNYMGMNNTDYGGGVPVTVLWRPDNGISIGSVEMVPRLISLPVEYDNYEPGASISVEYEFDDSFKFMEKDTLATYETFVSVHQGDHFPALRKFSQLMQKKGIKMADVEEAAFEPIWCAWGYERNFTCDEIIGTLPKVKELGIKWAVVDDGFQQAEGDWQVNRQKFPNGEKDMIKLVDKIHAYGLKAKIWWVPLALDPDSKLYKEQPDLLLRRKDGSPQYISWWNSFYMSPTYKGTLEHTKSVVTMFIKDWGFDGLKLDGQNMNAVAPDYNPVHKLEYPGESVEKLPDFYKFIYNIARSYKPNAVIENCPCGACMSFYNMPYTNQVVSSDPLNSWQVRLKGKTYKALLNKAAYYGDHVEISDNGSDFASSFGVGAVLGTKFTWPKDNPTVTEKYVLTTEKEKTWKKWFALYNQKMLSKEDYLGNLYDIGYDRPETHVIQKADTLYYAFYADTWEGNIELRGLPEKSSFIVHDYVNGKTIGEIQSDDPIIDVKFEDHLLIEVYPCRYLQSVK